MAGKAAVWRDCERRNRQRNVRTIHQYSYRRFWERAKGNFMITGGDSEARTAALCEKLTLDMRRTNIPTVVLTSSCELENRMIDIVKRTEPGLLYVTSPDHPFYAFFDGWSRTEIVNFINLAAASEYNQAGMAEYANAQLNLFNGAYSPDLASIVALASYSDDTIRQIGRGVGVSDESMDIIAANAEGGRTFRLVLAHIAQAMGDMTTSDPEILDMNNLSTETLTGGCLHLIRINSRFPEIVNLYFAEELKRLRKRMTFRLVLSDLYISSETDPLKNEALALASSNTEIGVSARNAVPILGEAVSFQSRIVLPRVSYRRGEYERYSDGELRSFLEPLGYYTHYEPGLGAAAPPKLLPILAGISFSPIPEQRLRVRPSDTDGCDAVLYGSSGGEILLARQIL